MSLKSRLEGRECLAGCFLSIPHPVSAEICARQGADVLCIDAEHAMIDRAEIESMVRACDIGKAPAMVRVPGPSPEWIGSALDSGAEAILVPRISSAEDARSVVRYARFPPQGQRGAGPGRSSQYGYSIMPYVGQANARTLIAVQIETAEGLAAVDDIAAVEGVDMLFVGPFDLALSLDALGDAGGEKLNEAIKQVAAAGRRTGKLLGMFRPSTADIPYWNEKGFNFFLVGSDAMFMGTGVAAMMDATRAGGASG